jgi:hypothetical protein
MDKSSKRPAASPRKHTKSRTSSKTPKLEADPMDMAALVRQIGERVMRRLKDEARQRQSQTGKRQRPKR